MIEKYWIVRRYHSSQAQVGANGLTLQYAIPVMIMLAMGGGGAEEGAPPPK